MVETWVLIAWLFAEERGAVGANGVTAITQEFNTEQACSTAGTALTGATSGRDNDTRWEFVCTPKGDGP